MDGRAGCGALTTGEAPARAAAVAAVFRNPRRAWETFLFHGRIYDVKVRGEGQASGMWCTVP